MDPLRWFTLYVRRSYANGWVHDDGTWLIEYGKSMLRTVDAERIVKTARKDFA